VRILTVPGLPLDPGGDMPATRSADDVRADLRLCCARRSDARRHIANLSAAIVACTRDIDAFLAELTLLHKAEEAAEMQAFADALVDDDSA
jgi:hypothetical protein